MASPVDSNRVGTNITTAATSHTINVGSPAAGNLLVVLVRFAGAPGTVTFTGYTLLVSDTSDASDDQTEIYWRWADGTEGATDPMSTGNSIKLATICWVITGAANQAPYLSAVAISAAANIRTTGVPGTIDSGNSVSTSASVNGVTGTSEMVGQSFVPGADITTTQFGFQLFKGGTPTDNLVIELQSDSAGVPSGTVLSTIATVDASTLTTTQSGYHYDSANALTNGTKYWVVFSRSGARDTTNRAILGGGSVGITGEQKQRGSGTWGGALSDLAIRVTTTPSADYLFMTVIGMDSETATATQPTGYSNLGNANSGTAGAVATNCMIWGASKAATAISDDPVAWTSSAPNAGVTGWTIAIAAPAATFIEAPSLIALQAVKMSTY